MSYGLGRTPRNRSAEKRRCPRCQGELVRERRRIVDQLCNWVHPAKRYRCVDFSCRWVGNLSSRRATDQPATRVPALFVVHMVLVAVGIVFVVLFSSLENSSWVAENAKAFESTFLPVPAWTSRSVDAR